MTEIDPICFRKIDTDRYMARTKYKARDFYFCSQECYETFQKAPEFYYIMS